MYSLNSNLLIDIYVWSKKLNLAICQFGNWLQMYCGDQITIDSIEDQPPLITALQIRFSDFIVVKPTFFCDLCVCLKKI